MILIADSGSSKTDWRLLKKDGTIEQAQSIGYNPYYQSVEFFDKEIADVLVPQIKHPVEKIFYYGTGVSSEKNVHKIKSVLNKYFNNAFVEVSHDLLGSARALCGSEKGIACILGTGSNSCQYDGKKIVHNVMSQGYVLGDEGSGAYLGKLLISDYLRNDIPEKLSEQFKKRFPMERHEILDRVYSQEMPSRFLGGFTHFIFQHLKEPYCYRLVYDSFTLFMERNVMRYTGYKEMKVHFVGSVAFYFSDLLRQVANDKGITVKNILESPIAGLALYHKKDIE